MNERRAREVTLLEAFETAQPASPSWSDDDRALGRPRRARGGDAGGSRPPRSSPTRAGHALQRLRRASRAARALARARRGAPAAWSRSSLIALRARPRRRRDRRRPAHQPAGAAALGRRWLEPRGLRAARRAAAGAPGAAPAGAAAGRSCALAEMLLRAAPAAARRASSGGAAGAGAPLRRRSGSRAAARLAAAARGNGAARRRGRAGARPDRRPLCARPRPRLPRRLGKHLPRRRRGARARHDRARARRRADAASRCPTRRRSRRCGSRRARRRRVRRRRRGSICIALTLGARRRRAARCVLALACGLARGVALAPLRAAARRAVLPAPGCGCSAAARRGSSSCPTRRTPSPQATLGLRALLAATLGDRRASTCASRRSCRSAPRTVAPGDIARRHDARDRAVRPRRDARGRAPDALRCATLRRGAADRRRARAIVDASAFARRFAGVDTPRRRAARGLARRGAKRAGTARACTVDLESRRRRRGAEPAPAGGARPAGGRPRPR